MNFLVALGFGTRDLGFAVPSRDAVSPPHLPADAPISNVLQPLRVNFLPMPGKESDQLIAHHRQRLFCFGISQKPLFTDAWLNWHIAAIAEPDIVFVRLRFRERSPHPQ